MEILPPTAVNLDRAAEALRAGEVVAYPTETVYGLGVDPFNEAALDRLYRVKRRDPQHAVLLIIGDLDQMCTVAAPLSASAVVYARAFWPGPLSLLLPPAFGVPPALLGPDGEVCLRWTSHPVAAALCSTFGGAIVSTSANLSGQPSARRPSDVPTDGVAICIDGGESGSGPPSTVFDPESGRILREGAISREALERVRP